MTKEDLKKSIDELVDQALEKSSEEEIKADSVEKGGASSVRENENRLSNGGATGKNNDNYKSGSPNTEDQEMYGKKKMKKAEDEDESEEKVEKGHDKKDDMKSDHKDTKDKDDKMMKKKDKDKKMYKSQDESFDLDDEEVQLVKAWRAEKSSEDNIDATHLSEESITKAMATALEPLKKSIEEKDSLIKGLQDKMEEIANQPAYEKRSLDSLETIEKGGLKQETISKSQTLDRMLELQQAGKGITAIHVAEFESTNNISDPHAKAVVMNSFKN